MSPPLLRPLRLPATFPRSAIPLSRPHSTSTAPLPSLAPVPLLLPKNSPTLVTALISERSSSLPATQLCMKFWHSAIDAIYTNDNGTAGGIYTEPTVVLLGKCLQQSPYLLLESLSISSPTHDHITSYIGKTLGIAAILRGVPLILSPSPPTSAAQARNTPYHNPSDGGPSRSVVLLPVEGDVLLEGGAAKGLNDIFEIATRANDHLLTTDMIKDARGKGELGMGADRGTFMSAVPTKKFLKRLENFDFNIFDKCLSKRGWLLPWSAYWTYGKGQF
ncbi:hypothetical protein BDZ91DRAFT_786912 [Kalaharituber pfeilii]|nr:hypothetical protein BDZ91DRAFT_786912 [Kalaharituber pfeilii]